MNEKSNNEIIILNKEIVVITAFHGMQNRLERLAILNYQRIRYIIEKHVDIIKPFGGNINGIKIKFKVEVAYSEIGNVPEESLDKILAADIIIAILEGVNTNVICELAIRNLMKTETLLIISGDPVSVLPIQFQTMAHLCYDHKNYLSVKKTINNIADTPEKYPLSWGAINEIPNKLAVAIDDEDSILIEHVTNALFRLETNPPKPVPALRKIVNDISPMNVLNSWETFIPWSIVKINWKKQSLPPLSYDKNDIDGEPIVCNGNVPFMELFDIQSIPDSEGKTPLTYITLISHIKRFVDKEHMEAFNKEQAELTNRILFEGGSCIPTVPLQFNDMRKEAFKNSVYLPVLIGKRRVGAYHAPHTTYLFISFIKDFWPIDYTKNSN